jgi:hypothetical protein
MPDLIGNGEETGFYFERLHYKVIIIWSDLNGCWCHRTTRVETGFPRPVNAVIRVMRGWRSYLSIVVCR